MAGYHVAACRRGSISQVPSVVVGTGAEPPYRYAFTYTLDHNEAAAPR